MYHHALSVISIRFITLILIVAASDRSGLGLLGCRNLSIRNKHHHYIAHRIWTYEYRYLFDKWRHNNTSYMGFDVPGALQADIEDTE